MFELVQLASEPAPASLPLLVHLDLLLVLDGGLLQHLDLHHEGLQLVGPGGGGGAGRSVPVPQLVLTLKDQVRSQESGEEEDTHVFDLRLLGLEASLLSLD